MSSVAHVEFSSAALQRQVSYSVILPEVGEPGAELVAQEPEQAKDQIAVACRVAHDLVRAQAGLLLQQALQDEQGVADRARHDDGRGSR